MSGVDLEVLMISILSLLHRAQVLFPNDFTTEIGLPCQIISHLIKSRCIPSVGAAASLGQMLAKCLV